MLKLQVEELDARQLADDKYEFNWTTRNIGDFSINILSGKYNHTRKEKIIFNSLEELQNHLGILSEYERRGQLVLTANGSYLLNAYNHIFNDEGEEEDA